MCSAASIEWFAEEGKRICGDLLETTIKDLRMVTTKQPVGVVAAITPWNFPCRLAHASCPIAYPHTSLRAIVSTDFGPT